LEVGRLTLPAQNDDVVTSGAVRDEGSLLEGEALLKEVCVEPSDGPDRNSEAGYQIPISPPPQPPHQQHIDHDDVRVVLLDLAIGVARVESMGIFEAWRYVYPGVEDYPGTARQIRVEPPPSSITRQGLEIGEVGSCA
jgi:hypothetical protein